MPLNICLFQTGLYSSEKSHFIQLVHFCICVRLRDVGNHMDLRFLWKEQNKKYCLIAEMFHSKKAITIRIHFASNYLKANEQKQLKVEMRRVGVQMEDACLLCRLHACNVHACLYMHTDIRVLVRLSKLYRIVPQAMSRCSAILEVSAEWQMSDAVRWTYSNWTLIYPPRLHMVVLTI